MPKISNITLAAKSLAEEKIKKELGYVPSRSIDDAVWDLIAAFQAGKLPDSMSDIRYYNIKTMKALKLK